MKLLKPILFSFAAFSLNCCNSNKDVLEREDNLMHQANQVADAFLKKDFETVVRFTNPGVLQKMGGKRKFLGTVSTVLGRMQEEGATFREVTIGRPEKIVKVKNEYHSILPETIVMAVNGGTFTTTSFLYATSHDQGENWYFIDGSSLTKDNIKLIVPSYDGQLEIPESKQPVFHSAIQ